MDSILHADHSDTPYFAKQYADCLYLIDLKIASELEHKARPAFTAAEKVREMSGQKRVLQEQCKLQEYQLNLYEAAFPWLSEFKEISPEDLASVVNIASTPENEYSTLKKWLSPQEYQTLSEADRLQLALDRYSIGKKATGRSALNMSDMSATVTSKKGYKVRYFGATEGLEDMGRDLIVSKEKKAFRYSMQTLGCRKNDSRKAHISTLWNDYFASYGAS